MKILARPGLEIGELNPYTRLLYEPMRKSGHSVDEFHLLRALTRKYDILHFHWPEYYVANPNPIKAIIGSLGTLLAVASARARGTKIVWTTHNLESHRGPRRRMERWFMEAFTKSLHAFIAMTSQGREESLRMFPHLRSLSSFVIPHGNYRGAYPNFTSKDSARSFLHIPGNSKVICFFGTISKYKGVPQLISAFRQLSGTDLTLLIAGAPDDSKEAALLEQQAIVDSRIRLRMHFVPREDVQYYFNAADLVVLPFTKIWNSGSAMLALSFDRPILVPARGCFSDLREQVGAEWIRTYPENLTSSELQEALAWATNAARPVSAPLETFEWTRVAEETICSYMDLASMGNSQKLATHLQGSRLRTCHEKESTGHIRS